ncbi:hypothetical protein QFZ36_001774 [Pseudarthrobacter siccitolerans]|uniref:DUF4244 domain-containing protein n=1 Tax=Pseudarthrobacter siccitolerans TaxID=861266 RepID=A0ABU0PJS1_9MICC|nr:DUF4244 domain-containing protein [Pseudarthrobacter siccitolerans]MDQ0674213.1 hypothetical protein [Pseudarthrobacter siccitolerans]
MTINQDRRFAAGTAALAAARPNIKRRTAAARCAGAPPAGAASLPANVVELDPGATGGRPTATRGRRTGIGMLQRSEAGMATAEYAIATLAAVGFAGLLVFILRSEEVRGFLLNLIRTALALP